MKTLDYFLDKAHCNLCISDLCQQYDQPRSLAHKLLCRPSGALQIDSYIRSLLNCIQLNPIGANTQCNRDTREQYSDAIPRANKKHYFKIADKCCNEDTTHC